MYLLAMCMSSSKNVYVIRLPVFKSDCGYLSWLFMSALNILDINS